MLTRKQRNSEVPQALETRDLPEQKEPAAVVLSSEEKEAGQAWLRLGVCEPIVKGLLELGFHSPTEIQQACIPSGLLKYKVDMTMVIDRPACRGR